MNEFQTERIIASYEDLEDKFQSFLKNVPYHKKNKKTWSPQLADILVSAGSLLDSFFRMSMPSKHNNKNRKEFKINDYCSKFSTDLVQLRSFVYVAPPILISPYENWSQHACPSWWADYNSVKHDRIKNMTLATVDITMFSLCGLFEAITQNKIMVKALIRHNWMDLGGYNPDLLIPELTNRQTQKVIGDLNMTFLVQSKLFVATLGEKSLPDEVKKIRPVEYIGGKKLIAYLGKWSDD